MKAKILLVDDEAHIRNVLKRLLARRLPEVEIVEASSAEEAMAIARERAFDVVLTDYRMDGATGADLLRHLSVDAPGTARVLATGYQDDAIIEEAVRGLDLDARLPKPWDNDTVVTVLKGILAQRSGEGASAAAAEGV